MTLPPTDQPAAPGVTQTEPDMSDAPQLELVAVMICSWCLDGRGGECHTPGCLYWMQDAPLVPQREAVIALTVQVPMSHMDEAAWRHVDHVKHRGIK